GLTKATEKLLVFNLNADFTANCRIQLNPDSGGAAHQHRIQLRCPEKAEGSGSTAEQAGRAQSKVAHELGEMQHGVEFERDGDQGLGAAPMLLGLVQVTGQFESDGDLRSQSAGAADVFVVDRARLDAVEHTEHSEHIAVRTEQGNRQQLANLESSQEIPIRSRSCGGVFGDEHIFFLQRTCRGAIVERDIDGTGDAVLHSPSNVKGSVFKEPDEAAPEAEKTGGPHGRGLHELVEFSGGTKLEGNLQDFVQFAGLSPRHAVQLGVGDGDCP